ncbi:MAG: hypothetical protein ACO2ZM_06250, partial [Francisellaceae bacterium]
AEETSEEMAVDAAEESINSTVVDISTPVIEEETTVIIIDDARDEVEEKQKKEDAQEPKS